MTRLTRRRRALVGATLTVLLVAAAVALLVLVEWVGPPEAARQKFEPRIPGSVCIGDPILTGVDALVQSERAKDAITVQVRWTVVTASSSATQRLSRDLREKGFRVSARVIASTQTNVSAVRTERKARTHLRVIAKTINAAAARASSEVVSVETPAGGCEGNYVPAT